MNRIIFIIVLLVFCAGIGLSNAELYEWVDKDGVKHFSNDESDVPPAISFETEDEIPYDPEADALREKQDKKKMEAVNAEEAEINRVSENADEQAPQTAAPASTVIIEEDHYHDGYQDHERLRERELNDADKLNEPVHEMHPEVHHEHKIYEREAR